MIIYNQIVVNPEPFRHPSLFISPFDNAALQQNQLILENNAVFTSDGSTFWGKHFVYRQSGRSAIFAALSQYALEKDDEIAIYTTTQNLYVSNCVTSVIEQFCAWKRIITNRTKLIFLIHEFGTCAQLPESWINANVPIIEDFAMSMFTDTANADYKHLVEFEIYSLPKFFPIQYGGVLVSNTASKIKLIKSDLHSNHIKQLHQLATYYYHQKEDILTQRFHNHAYLQQSLESIGLTSFWKESAIIAPSVFMFNGHDLDLVQLKIFMQSNGIECSKFYGEEAFFIPVHQNLSEAALNLMVTLIKYFKDESK